MIYEVIIKKIETMKKKYTEEQPQETNRSIYAGQFFRQSQTDYEHLPHLQHPQE